MRIVCVKRYPRSPRYLTLLSLDESKSWQISSSFPSFNLQELASQTHQSRSTTSPTNTTTLTLHVHLQRHLRSTVDSRLLITGLVQTTKISIAHTPATSLPPLPIRKSVKVNSPY